MNGKGSKRRPRTITRSEEQLRWDAIFNKQPEGEPMKTTEQNKDCKLLLAQPLIKEGGTRHVYLEKPNGAIKCIGVLMGTTKGY